MIQDKAPFFSVIIPTYERPGSLGSCLQALQEQDYQQDCFEVIVVDDGSRQPPYAVVGRFEKSLQIRMFTQKNTGPAAARNRGAAHARGNYYAFTDDDCRPSRGWLKNLALRLEQNPDHGIGGRTSNILEENPYAAASQIILDVLYASFDAGLKHLRFYASNNLTFPAKGFHAIGGFDTSLRTSEDREICDRWVYHGFSLAYAPEALVYHAHPLTFASFCQVHFAYGRGAFWFQRKRIERGQGRIQLAMPFYRALFRYPTPNGRSPWTLRSLLALSQLANAAGFFGQVFHQAMKRRHGSRRSSSRGGEG